MIHSTALCIVTCDGRVLFSKADWPFYLYSYDRDFFTQFFFSSNMKYKKNQYLSRAGKDGDSTPDYRRYTTDNYLFWETRG